MSEAAVITQGDPLAELEDAIVARLRAAFAGTQGRALKTVAPIEGPFDETAPKHLRIAPPAAYVTPLQLRPSGYPGSMETFWTVYAVSDRATSLNRTRGGASNFGIGAYAIAWRVAAALDAWLPGVPGVSTMELVGVENLSGLALADKKLSIFAVSLRATLARELENPGADLADFLIFNTDWDVPAHEDAPDELPAARDFETTLEIPR